MYEHLAEIEKRFEDVEVKLLRQNYILTQPIYAERAKLVQKIPHFWAIVAEEAPEEIDRRIQPCDTAALSLLQQIEVTRFEVLHDAPETGEPRSVKIVFSFRENPLFEDQVLEKKFWYRRGKDGWTGLVSDPVRIHWKKGKDVTEGLLDEAVDLFEVTIQIKEVEGQMANQSRKDHSMQERLDELLTLHQNLADKLANNLKIVPQDAVSFFAWFGYRGREVSAEESAEANRKETHMRNNLKSGNEIVAGKLIEAQDGDGKEVGSIVSKAISLDELDGNELDHEIFPAGEELAVAISEDLFPGAIKYFTQAQEKDATDSNEEEDAGESDSDSEGSTGSEEPATKRLKTGP
ncbi:hypothetical protein MMC07_007935 [Pseudocyphellaria aurata]|nr:hypothetical protein [Pseudocyphellaria aurata]